MGTIGLRQLFDYDTWTYTYLLWDQENKEAVIIDPVREQYLRDLEAVTDLQLKLVYALGYACSCRPCNRSGDV